MDEVDHDLLIRIDERTKTMHAQWSAAMPTFVTKKEFAPVKSIVYGMVGLILLSVCGAILGNVVSK